MKEETKACLHCGGVIKSRATRCKHCREPIPGPELVDAKLSSSSRYRFLEPIDGRATFGPTYRAEDLSGETPTAVVIKTIPEEALGFAERQSTVLEALRATVDLDHNHVAPILDAYVVDSELNQVRSYLEGRSLREILHTRGRLPLEDVRSLGSRLLQTLHFLHTQAPAIVHGNLHPGNVLIDGAGRPFILDLGLSQLANRETMRGVPGDKHVFVYMSPEQIRGEPPQPASDLYSLGVLLFEALTGTPPFPQTTPGGLECRQGHLTERPPLIRMGEDPAPEAIQDLLAELLAKSAEYRLPDIQKGIQQFHGGTIIIPASRPETQPFMPSLQQALSEELARSKEGTEQPPDEGEEPRPTESDQGPPAAPPPKEATASTPGQKVVAVNRTRTGSTRVVASILFAILLGVAAYHWGLPLIRTWMRPAPEEVIDIAAKAFKENDPASLHELLPESYQRDIDETIQMFATRIDAETYDNFVAGIRHMTKGAAKHRSQMKEFLFSDSQLSELDQDRLLAQLATLSEVIITSDLQSHARLKKLDVENFLDEHGNSVMSAFRQFRSITGDSKSLDDMDDLLTGYEIRTLRETEDVVVLEVEKYGKSEEWEFIQVEGKWIPKEFRKAWLKGLLEISEGLDKAFLEYEQKKTLVRAASKVFFEAAKNYDETGSMTELRAALMAL